MSEKDEVEKQIEEMPIIKAMKDYINPALNYTMAVQLLEENLPVMEAAKKLTEINSTQENNFPSFEEMAPIVNHNAEIISLLREINENSKQQHEAIMSVLQDIVLLQQAPEEDKPHIIERITQTLSNIGSAVDAVQSVGELIQQLIPSGAV
ncbi:hypothetical protein [Kurthia massiliensis]|uniref:hypothetical protein n=1 Tax=Kurthia massiliensis TaxID=1033739 RepID=UPI000289AE1A|nr:hypothetical protein [Kurthia massiliensis]